MNIKEIEILLERYYEGETSLAEEKVLRDFFTAGNVPAHLAGHRSLFVFMEGESRAEIPDTGFERRVTDSLTTPASGRVVPLHPARRGYLYALSLAASVLLLAGLFFALRRDGFRLEGRAGHDPAVEHAWNDTRQALLMLSGNFNHGLEQVGRLESVDHAMENIILFNKFYQYQTLIINPDDRNGSSIK